MDFEGNTSTWACQGIYPGHHLDKLFVKFIPVLCRLNIVLVAGIVSDLKKIALVRPILSWPIASREC